MKRWKGMIEVLALCLAIIVGFFGSAYVLNHQFSFDELRVRGFYRLPKNSLDMVLIGSSAAYSTLNSAIAWKEEGFTSYTLATSGAPMGIAKSMLKEALKYQNPKLIMIDVNGVLYNDYMEQREGMTRLWIDNIPLSKNKFETINELTDGKDPISWLVPLYKYHGSWEKIGASLRYTKFDLQMRLGSRPPYAFSMRNLIGTSKRNNLIDVILFQERRPLHGLSGSRFRDLLNYLKSNHINNVVFFNMPRYYDKKMLADRRLLNEASDLASKEGFRVYDFDKEIDQMNLDPEKDYYDSGHLNMIGQQKATRYFARKINENYRLNEIQHSEEIVAQWNREYEAYQKVFDYSKKDLEQGRREEVSTEMIDDILSR